MPAKLAIVSLFDKLDRSRGADIPPTSANTLDLENNVVFSALNSKFPHTLYAPPPRAVIIVVEISGRR